MKWVNLGRKYTMYMYERLSKVCCNQRYESPFGTLNYRYPFSQILHGASQSLQDPINNTYPKIILSQQAPLGPYSL
jgi:hypothetical protein